MLTYDEWKKLYVACKELTVASTFLLTLANPLSYTRKHNPEGGFEGNVR